MLLLLGQTTFSTVVLKGNDITYMASIQYQYPGPNINSYVTEMWLSHNDIMIFLWESLALAAWRSSFSKFPGNAIMNE